MSEPGSVNGPTYRLTMTAEQLLAERVHLSLSSPVTQQTIRTQRTGLIVVSGVLVVLGLVVAVLPPLTPDGEPASDGSGPLVGALAAALGIAGVVFGVAAPAYYRHVVRRLEGRMWTYLGDDGAVVELSAQGVALEAPARSARLAWGYYDDAASLPTGLELRRRGGPVGFYPAAAFGSPAEAAQAAADVRTWIAHANPRRA